MRAIEEEVTKIKEAAISTGLVINERKTKYMKISTNVTHSEQDLIMDLQVYEGVQICRYLGTVINLKKINDEIKSRIITSNTCFHSLGQIFRYTTTRKEVKIKIHKTIVNPDTVFGSEIWVMTEMGMKSWVLGEEGIEVHIWSGGRARSMENKN